MRAFVPKLRGWETARTEKFENSLMMARRREAGRDWGIPAASIRRTQLDIFARAGKIAPR